MDRTDQWGDTDHMHEGAYTADRAAALSGVPWSTVHDWARKGVLVPSVSPTKTKLWSYADLMGLRTIYWLRQNKEGHDQPFRRSTMNTVKAALQRLAELDLDLWSEDHGPAVRVDAAGMIFLSTAPSAEDLRRQRVLDDESLDLLAPFETDRGIRGPDLVAPRPTLRIVPGKIGGSPHIQRTRLETRALAALAKRGVGKSKIYRLYPDVPTEGIDESLDLEYQLDRNLSLAAA